jgi:hypothetical protein
LPGVNPIEPATHGWKWSPIRTINMASTCGDAGITYAITVGGSFNTTLGDTITIHHAG